MKSSTTSEKEQQQQQHQQPAVGVVLPVRGASGRTTDNWRTQLKREGRGRLFRVRGGEGHGRGEARSGTAYRARGITARRRRRRRRRRKKFSRTRETTTKRAVNVVSGSAEDVRRRSRSSCEGLKSSPPKTRENDERVCWECECGEIPSSSFSSVSHEY